MSQGTLQPAQQPVLAARWPGYAIEGGELFETAGVVLAADGEGRVSDVQAWRRIERVHKQALFAVLLQAEPLRFRNMPSAGMIW